MKTKGSGQSELDPRALLRRRDAGGILGVSESQILKWESKGLLTPIAMPGIRATRLQAGQVLDLASRIAAGTDLETLIAQAKAGQ